MNTIRFAAMAALALTCAVPCARAATIESGAQTLAATADLAARLPAAHEFTVVTPGAVTLTLSDLSATPIPAPFQMLQAVVTLGPVKVASLNAAGSTQFVAQAGTYRVQVVGRAGSPASSYSIEVRAAAGNALLLAESRGVQAVAQGPSAADSSLETRVALSTPGLYQVTLRDRAFPAALASIDLAIVRRGGTAIDTVLAGPCAVTACTGTLNVSAGGEYDLFVEATAGGPGQAGLYSLSLTGPGAVTVIAQSYPVGRLPEPAELNLPSAGNYSVTLADLALPAAFSTLQGIVTQGATLVGAPFAAGTTALTGAMAGTAKLHVAGVPATSGGVGAYAVRIAQGTQGVFQDARPVPAGFSATANLGAYRFTGSVATAGTYRLILRDHQFPVAFSQLRAAVVQDGASILTQNGAGTTASFTLNAGPVQVIVAGAPQSAGANSLFGFALEPATGGAAVTSGSQGVGALFGTRNLTIVAAGSYDAVVSDLQFPSGFQELAAAITQGPNLIGQIFGSGRFPFMAQPGIYSINLLARPVSNAEYGTWGYEISNTPPAPTISFTAAASNVAAQGSTTLTWSAANATSCTATGGWTGSKPTSGSESTAPLSAATTFTLSCMGAGGSTSGSVTVGITPPVSSGGGGRVDYLLLGLALLLLGLRLAPGNTVVRRSC